MWLRYSLVIFILLTVESNPAHGYQPKVTKAAMISVMKDMSSALARMKESMSSMSTAVSDMSSAFNRMKQINGISESDFMDDLKTGTDLLDTMTGDLSSAFAELDFKEKISALSEEPENHYRVTRVSKNDTGDYYEITLEYIPFFIRPEVTVFMKEADVVFGGDRDIRKLGKVFVNINKTSNSGDVMIFIKFSLGVRFMLTLDLDCDTPEEVDIPRVVASVSPENGEIVYEPGTQPRLELTLWTEELDSQPQSDLFVYPSFMLRSGDELVTYYSRRRNNPINLQVLHREGRPGFHHWTYGINSSFPDPEGELRLETELFYTNYSCLVKSLSMYVLAIKFHTTDHAAPFPENFFGFFSHDPDVNRTMNCEAEAKSCLIECGVLWADQSKNGSAITVGIKEVTSDGDVVETDDNWESHSSYSFSALKLENITLADFGRVFRCTARSGQREITKDYELLVSQPPTIIEELSSATSFGNGSVAVTCVIEGFPRPEISIDFYDARGMYKNYHDVNVANLNETVTMATALIATTSDYLGCRSMQDGQIFYDALSANNHY